MNPASPTPPPRAHGRVCVRERRECTHTNTRVYTFSEEMLFYQSPPHRLSRHMTFPPNPSLCRKKKNALVRNELKQAKIPGLNLVAGGKSGPLSCYTHVIPENHFSTLLAALNWERLLKHISIFLFYLGQKLSFLLGNPGSEHHIHQVYPFLPSSRRGKESWHLT